MNYFKNHGFQNKKVKDNLYEGDYVKFYNSVFSFTYNMKHFKICNVFDSENTCVSLQSRTMTVT